MKKCMLLWAVLPWLCPTLQGQVWCPPGATWHYGFNYPQYNGYYKYTYLGDTVIGGITETVIGKVGHFYMQDPPGYHVVPEADVRTRMENGVLYIFHDPPGSQSGAAWDTLIWYSAVPGDHWQVLPPDDFECDIRFLVTDTGHAVLAGIGLRYVQTTVMEGGTALGTRRFLERIGSMLGTFRGECLEIYADTTLRCYQDIGMNYAPPNAPACDFISAIEEASVQAALVFLFPNPGTDVLFIETTAGLLDEVLLRDALGRVCLHVYPNAQRTELHAQALPPGFYTVEASTPQGKQVRRWLKQ